MPVISVLSTMVTGLLVTETDRNAWLPTANTLPALPTSLVSEHVAPVLIERRYSSLSNSHTVVTYEASSAYAIQVVATTMASLSVTASMIALYWFCLMRRNYRRDLVLLLILSDLLKNFCFVLYAGVNFNNGPVQDGDAICQASGYLLQTGLEACDVAIFFISLHMFLQIFPRPNMIFGYDGLYNVRYWVYVIWICAPNISASLAFINDNHAYAVQGTWCWLPVRPFWYRLALAWIPRYIISSLILGFAIAIYIHVGTQFNLFGRERGRSPSSDLSVSISNDIGRESQSETSPAANIPKTPRVLSPRMQRGMPLDDANVDPFARNMFVSPAVGTALPDSRRHSLPSWVSPFKKPPDVEHGHKQGSVSEAPSRRSSKQVMFEHASNDALSPLQHPEPRPARPPMISYGSSANASLKLSRDGIGTPLSTLTEAKTASSLGREAEAALKARNIAIKRQVRGLFAYPVAYIVFWIMPFVMHCMNYSDRFAAQPLLPVALLSSFSVTSLGLVDVIIFCWRERPWRHIAASDGTFTGSFCFWNFTSATGGRNRAFSIASGIAATEEKAGTSKHKRNRFTLFSRLEPWRRLSSGAGGPKSGAGTSDSKARENEEAQTRLRLERQAMQEKAVAEAHTDPQAVDIDAEASRSRQMSPGARDWFDRDMNDDPDDQIGVVV